MCALNDQPPDAAGESSVFRQRAALLAHMIESAPEIMGACDSEGHVILLNRAGREWFGLPDTAGRSPEIGCADLFPPATARLIKEVALPAALRDGQWRGEMVMRDRDGRERPVDQTITVLREADGAVAGFGTTIHDRAALEEVQKALLESEQRFSKAFYASPDPYVIADFETGQIFDVNDSFVRTFGWSREEAHGHRASEVGLWADLAERDRFLEVLRRDGEVREMGQHRRTRAGEVLVCLCTAFRVNIGGCAHTLYRLRNVTQERTMERALRDSEELFSVVFRESPVPLLVTELATGQIVVVNDRFCESLGWARDQLLGRAVGEFKTWVDQGEREAAYTDIQLHGSVRNRIVRLRNRAGDIRQGRFSGEQLELGGRKCVLTVFEDLTDLLRAEAAMRESEEKFAKAFHSSPDSMVIVSSEGTRVIDINEGFTLLHGWTREEAVGRSVAELGLWAHAADRDRILAQLYAGQPVRNTPTEMRDRQGGLHQCLYSGEISEIGGVRCSISIVRDVTDRQRLEEQLRQAQKMEAVGQLAGGVAHDFNNILTVIQAHTSLLREDQRLPAEVQDSLREIAQSAHFAASLTRQLLLFSRKQVLQPGRVALSEVVARMAQMLKRIIGETVVLEFSAPPDVPDIQADAGMVEQVLLNLVVNARDAMPRGGRITIATRVVTADADYVRRVPQARTGRFVGLGVRDTGEGIAPEILSRIFDPFFTTKEEGKGTGLGLATVYGIIEQHGGWIEVESQPGAGAQFVAWFPARERPVAAASRNSKPPMEARPGETILVVEDKDDVRAVMRAVLARYGYRVVLAADGEEALVRWAEHEDEIALLITDVVMPGRLTGRDLAAQLRAARPVLKVIYCSGYDAEILDSSALDRSGTRFLAKPFDVARLAKMVRELLDEA